MLNCQQVTRLISDSKEMPLSLSKRMSLRMHTLMCSGCRNFGKQMGFLRDVMQAYAKGKDEDSNK